MEKIERNKVLTEILTLLVENTLIPTIEKQPQVKSHGARAKEYRKYLSAWPSFIFWRSIRSDEVEKALKVAVVQFNKNDSYHIKPYEEVRDVIYEYWKKTGASKKDIAYMLCCIDKLPVPPNFMEKVREYECLLKE